MRLLFADRLPEGIRVELEARGHVCEMEPSLTADDLPTAVQGFDGLVVRSTKVRRPVFEAADQLALVIRAGSGTDTIDVDTASAHGVAVCNVPGRNAAAVAELTMGLLLAIDRQIADNVADLRNGHWDKKRYSTGAGLLGSTMAIIGLGSVGFAVAERAVAFGMHVHSLASPRRTAAAVARAEELGIVMFDSIPELLSSADVVTLHVPYGEDTHHLVDSTFLDQMQPGSILLNTSRGDVVDEQALLKALDASSLRAGLDVFADEPGSGTAAWDSPLARHPNVVGTHHIGASTKQAQRAIAEGVIEIVDAFVTGAPLSCVNFDRIVAGSAPDAGHREGAAPSAEVVRPFRARVVQPEWAPRVVAAMTDPFDETSVDPQCPAFDTEAYDDFPAGMYIYRQEHAGGSHTGLVCELDIEAFAKGQVRRHEGVDARRVEALVRHQATAKTPPALVTLLHQAGPTFVSTLDATCHTPPILDFMGPGGLRQTVWRVPDGPTVTALSEELVPADHYIADGHHRVAAALEEWQLAGRPSGAGLLCVVHGFDGLHLAAFHRHVSGPVDLADLLDLLATDFEVWETTQPPTPKPGSFGLYVAHRWYLITHRGTPEEGPSGLDAAILQAKVLDRLVSSRAVDITPVRESVDELVRQCDANGGALFTLAPPRLDTLTSLADSGALMPPKTTYFAPKPCVGIFLRS